jgi:peptide chain release factor 1
MMSSFRDAAQTLSHDQAAQLSKLIRQLEPLVALANQLTVVDAELAELEQLSRDMPELTSDVQTDMSTAGHRRDALVAAAIDALASSDSGEAGGSPESAMIELRAATGGAEAALFAADMLTLYGELARRLRWQFDLLSISRVEGGGVREAVAAVSGHAVFERMQFESGVHRVQRVPDTENSGRVHTSTITVAVLPEPTEVCESVCE